MAERLGAVGRLVAGADTARFRDESTVETPGVPFPGPVRAGARVVAAVRYSTVVAVALCGFVGIALWDVFHYNWLRGYDAWAASHYVAAIQIDHRLATPADTGVWHNPPLFYALAAFIQGHVGWSHLEPHKAVQLVSVVSGFGIVLFTFLIARTLFPRSRWIQLTALLVAALTPVLMRGSLLYHPDPLSTALATGGVYVAIRAAHGRWTVRLGFVCGLLLGLATLTRDWALAETGGVLAVCGVIWIRERRPEILRFLAAATIVFAGLALPWYIRQEVDYGSPFAFAKPGGPGVWLPQLPAGFFTSLDVTDVFTNPYQPFYKNALVPVLYTDWWGDYTRYFHIPLVNLNTPRQLPPRYRNPLVVQSFVGIVPSLLAIAGAVGLAIQGIRRRGSPVSIVLAGAGLVIVSFLWFLFQDPKVDGDNVKALYVLDILPAVAICTAWGLDWVRRHSNRLVLAGLLAWLAVSAVYDVSFLILRHNVS